MNFTLNFLGTLIGFFLYNLHSIRQAYRVIALLLRFMLTLIVSQLKVANPYFIHFVLINVPHKEKHTCVWISKKKRYFLFHISITIILWNKQKSGLRWLITLLFHSWLSCPLGAWSSAILQQRKNCLILLFQDQSSHF